ncbi:MAG: hypothetical protein AB8B69_15940 [Chitinophagales bacterium]
MNNSTDIYEWIELYLLGQLDKTELQKIEAKRKASKAFEEDLCAIEIEMYEEGRLPLERKRQFEARLKHDNNLARELALHKATFEVVKYFDNKGYCKDQNLISNEQYPPDDYCQYKPPFLSHLKSKWKYFCNICQRFVINK